MEDFDYRNILFDNEDMCSALLALRNLKCLKVVTNVTKKTKKQKNQYYARKLKANNVEKNCH